jgi:hypothetical protein
MGADQGSLFISHQGIAPFQNGFGIERLEAILQGLLVLLALLEAMAHGLEQAMLVLGQAILSLLQQPLWMHVSQVVLGLLQTLLGPFQSLASAFDQLLAQLGSLTLQFPQIRHDPLGSCRWGMGGVVGSVVSQGFIPLVANPGDHRDPTFGNGSHHPLIVKTGQIFAGSTAPRQKKHFRPPILFHPANGPHN